MCKLQRAHSSQSMPSAKLVHTVHFQININHKLCKISPQLQENHFAHEPIYNMQLVNLFILVTEPV